MVASSNPLKVDEFLAAARREKTRVDVRLLLCKSSAARPSLPFGKQAETTRRLNESCFPGADFMPTGVGDYLSSSV